MKTESTIQPKPITIERHNGAVHVVLAESVIPYMKDDTQMYRYDQTRVVTNDAEYEARKSRTLSAWKSVATPEVYDGCVRTENGLYPCVVVDKGARVALEPAEAVELATNTDIKVVEEAVTKG